MSFFLYNLKFDEEYMSDLAIFFSAIVSVVVILTNSYFDLYVCDY